ncbi:MAG TPA: hypothetical protein VG205_02905 [Acidimicrobiales bacterium]|nr:hypothetical protein [Acidimicrobiales bacterium]
MTFGTDDHAGVCSRVDEKLLSGIRRRGHSALTVTVADLGGSTRRLAGGR